MPYLSCPSCRTTVYSVPAVTTPAECSRCGTRLGEPVPSLFESDGPGGVSASRVLETLRARAAARGSGLEGGASDAPGR
jgi:hypothetical protein